MVLVVFFAIGVFLLDRALFTAGNALVFSRHWKDQLLRNLAKIPDQEIYILGGCRVVSDFDSKLIGAKLGKSVFNASVVADGLGNIDFALSVLLSHHAKGKIVFAIDDANWRQDGESAKPEIGRRLIWWNLLDPRQREEMSETYGIPQVLIRSGLWRFKGSGKEILRAVAKIPTGQPEMGAGDGYVPFGDIGSIVPSQARALELQKTTFTSFRPTEFASARIERNLQRAIAAGLQPILVIPPMHRFSSTDSVNRQQTALIRSLAGKYGLQYLSYLDNQGDLANDDSIWRDMGHLNRRGSEIFSGRFADDFQSLYKASP